MITYSGDLAVGRQTAVLPPCGWLSSAMCGMSYFEQATPTSQKGLSSASTTAGSVMNRSFLTVSSSRASADGFTVASGS